MPEVSTTERVIQGAVVYGAFAGANIASMVATSALNSQALKICKFIGMTSYINNDARLRSLAGVMTPVLFGVPSFDPLFPAKLNANRRNTDETDETDETDVIVFFGQDDMSIESIHLSLVLLCIGSTMYVICFVMMALNPHNMDTPPEPDFKPFNCLCCSLNSIAEKLICVVFLLDPSALTARPNLEDISIDEMGSSLDEVSFEGGVDEIRSSLD